MERKLIFIVPSPFSYIENYDREGDDNNNKADDLYQVNNIKVK